MYNQSFTAKELYACTTQSERRDLGISKEDFLAALNADVVQPISHGTFTFNLKWNGNMVINGSTTEGNARLYQDIVLRKIHRNIARIYNVKMSNRNQIVEQIATLLSEEVSLWIIRLDVRHFYNSINRKALINRITNDCRLSPMAINLICKIDTELDRLACDGLPQGLSISAALSELYMKYFDISVQHLSGVYYYARYVDDIFIFCSNKASQEAAWQIIPSMLKEIGLELNRNKSYLWEPNGAGKQLTYLGYTFSKTGKDVCLTIAEPKVKMIKTRIAKSFVSYANNHDFALLLMRVKFLTGNFLMFPNASLAPIMIGIYYNYKEITDLESLKDLDDYYHSILHCRSVKFGSRLALTDVQRKQLEDFSFFFGFKYRVRHHFTSIEMGKIKQCWR